MSTTPVTPLSTLLEPEVVKRTSRPGDSAFLLSIAISTKRIADELERQGRQCDVVFEREMARPPAHQDPIMAMAVAAEHGGGTMIADVDTYADGTQRTHAVATWEDPDEAR